MSMKSNQEWNNRKSDALTDVVGTTLGPYKRKNTKTNDLLWNSSVQIEDV